MSADTSRCLLTPPEDRKCKLDYGFVLRLVSLDGDDYK